MFSSKIYPFPYTENKSKKIYCRCYVVKLFLYFSFSILSPFSMFFLFVSLAMWRIFIIFLVARIFLVILFSFLRRTICNTWKNRYTQLQVSIMIFNKKALVNFSSISISKNPPWNLLSFMSRIVVHECLKNSVRNCLSFALISNYW